MKKTTPREVIHKSAQPGQLVNVAMRVNSRNKAHRIGQRRRWNLVVTYDEALDALADREGVDVSDLNAAASGGEDK